MILFFPLYFFSFLNNILPYQPVRNLIRNKIKDHAFDASIKFVLALVLFPLFWVLVSLALWLFGISGMYVLAYLIASVATSVLFTEANLVFRNANERKQLAQFQQNHSGDYDFIVKGLKQLNEFREKVLTSTK